MTPSLGLLLTTCALMAAPAKDEDPAARAQATLQRVAKLPLEYQRVWLRLVEQRYAWAVLLTLKPEDAQREQVRVAKILRQKTVGWNELITLLRQLDQREKAAIARLVRQYRSEVYETFRKRPRDLVDRQEAWYRIWSLWEKAGSPPEQQDRLMDWLADAIKVSSKNAVGPLPTDPKFRNDVELVPEQLVKQLTQPLPARPAESKPAAPEAPANAIAPRPEMQVRRPLLVRVPDPSREIGPTKLPPSEVAGRRTEKAQWLPLPTETPPAFVPPLHILPSTVADDPKELTTRPIPPHEAVVIVRPGVLTLAEEAPEMIARVGPREAKPRAMDATRQSPELPSARKLQPRIPEQPVAELVPVTAGPRSLGQQTPLATDIARSTEGTSSHDMVAEIPHRSAEFTLPNSQRPSEYRVERKALSPNTADQTAPASSPAVAVDQHAQVNVEELGTRIEGINLSLRNLEAELHEKHDLTADQLGSLLSRLDILVLRQKDLTLFRDLITPQEQTKVGRIDSSRSVVASMGTRIAEERTRIRDNQAISETERSALLKQLDELSDRLATMAAEK